jgi:hypothetical protein
MEKKSSLKGLISGGAAAIAVLFSTTNLYADDPCSQKAYDSVWGQVSRQLPTNLNLTQRQQAELKIMSGVYFVKIEDSLKLNRTNRTNLLSVIKKAATDKNINDTEFAEIENAVSTLQDSRMDVFGYIFSGKTAVESVLTDTQEQALKDYKPTGIVIPSEVNAAAGQVNLYVETAKAEYSATKSVTDQTKQNLYNSLISLLDAVYMPDDIRNNIKAQLEVVVELAGEKIDTDQDVIEKLQGREGIENLSKFIGNFMKSLENGTPITVDDMPTSFANASTVKKASLEVFMLTPVFQCNYNK